MRGLRGLRGGGYNADFEGYRAGVAARVGGVIRLDKGQGRSLCNIAVLGGQDRAAVSQRSIAAFDFVAYRYIVIADQRGGKGTVDSHLQRFAGGQGDVFGRNGCRGVCSGSSSSAQMLRGLNCNSNATLSTDASIWDE